MRKSTKLKIFRRKKRSVILSVLKRHSLRQHTIIIFVFSMKQKEEGKGNVAKAWNLPETGNNVV